MLVILLSSLLAFACGRDDVIYPSMYGKQQLATKLHCQVEEVQYFKYSSVHKLWGAMGNDIMLSADVALHCLGDDKGGKYESEALKYLAEISNLIMAEKKEDKELVRRRKRGVGEFFSKTWNRIKKFFSRVFRGGGGDNKSTISQAAPHDQPADKRKGVQSTDEEEEYDESTAEDLKPLYSVPFQFVQLANGSIPEIRFAKNEVNDGRIRNFKRHLVDVFATQLNFEQRQKEILETTVTGEHTSTYSIQVDSEMTPMTLAGFSNHKKEEPTVTVRKLVTEDDIRKLSPSEALNDRDRMLLNLQQMQIFKGGKLQSSSGTSSIVLFSEPVTTKRNRMKREEEIDLTSNFHIHSSYKIQLRKRQRRSTKDLDFRELHESLSFIPVSRLAEEEDTSERHKLWSLQQSSGNMTRLFQSLLSIQDKDYDETIQILSEMVYREVNLALDKEQHSASEAIRNVLTNEVMQLKCAENFTICKDFLQLLAVAGGPKAEKVFLSFLNEETDLTALQSRMVAGIITDFTSPSASFLRSMVHLAIDKKQDPDVRGSICLGCGSLGSRAELKVKNMISKTFTDILNERKNNCEDDDLLLDVLEAIGNLRCEKMVPEVLKISQSCKQNGAIQIASAHALRHHSELSPVKYWMQNMTNDSDCEIIKAVIGALLDKIQDQQMIGDTSNWPRNGFNQVDANLKQLLVKSQCSIEDIVLYFGKKRDPIAKELAENYYGPETEPWNPGSNYRQKRALWDNLNCDEWTADNKFRPIQDKEEFASDRAMYNKRKSCLAFRKLGVKGANAQVYAGIFAGIRQPSNPPKYKLFTKFVSSLEFLDQEMEIGSFYFYHRNGNTKAYVRILGKTRQEFIHDGCTPTDLKYRPIKHIPLYMVSISSVQLSLGIHLSSRLALDTECPDKDVYQMEPMTDVRIGGEALGTIALARGGVSLGGNFNYKLQFTFTPTPNMCVKGSHGHDPMTISFETYYQLWNAAKFRWGKQRVWKPNSLSWQIKKGELNSWFQDTCIKTEDHSPSINLERELE